MTTLEGVVPFPPEFAARYREKGYDDFPLSKFGKVSKHVLVKQITDILAEEEQAKKLAT